MLAKNLSFLAHADAAGIVLGARVPIVLASRADPGVEMTFAQMALSVLSARTGSCLPVSASLFFSSEP